MRGSLALTGLLFLATLALAGPPETLEDLRDMSVDQLAEVDIIRMNLIVAKELDPTIDIPAFERFVHLMAAYIQQQIQLYEPFFEADKADYEGSKEKWICVLLWETLRKDFGVDYLDGESDKVDHTQPRQKFVHGLLTNGQGTCCTIPVLYLAIAQRLELPLKPAVAPTHLYCHWVDDNGTRFNVKTTSSKGAVFPTDEQMYEFDPCPEDSRPVLYKTLNARELLGVFLAMRADHYCVSRLYRHAVVDLYNALLCYPDHPTMKRNLATALYAQRANRVYADSDELRSRRPRKPIWEHLPG